MAVSDDFRDLVIELFQPLGFVRTKRMFGGMGLYCDDLFFAILDDDQLYLKTDDENRAAFEEKGLEAFRIEMKGKVGTMPYYEAPEEIFEDPDAAMEWGRLALGAALRAAAKKKPKAKKAAPGRKAAKARKATKARKS